MAAQLRSVSQTLRDTQNHCHWLERQGQAQVDQPTHGHLLYVFLTRFISLIHGKIKESLLKQYSFNKRLQLYSPVMLCPHHQGSVYAEVAPGAPQERSNDSMILEPEEANQLRER